MEFAEAEQLIEKIEQHLRNSRNAVQARFGLRGVGLLVLTMVEGHDDWKAEHEPGLKERTKEEATPRKVYDVTRRMIKRSDRLSVHAVAEKCGIASTGAFSISGHPYREAYWAAKEGREFPYKTGPRPKKKK